MGICLGPIPGGEVEIAEIVLDLTWWLCYNVMVELKLVRGRDMWLEGFTGGVDLTPVFGPGCYALGRKNEVLYVGQSKVLINRLYVHVGARDRAARGKYRQGDRMVPFRQVMIWPCEVAELDELEQELIKLYQPRYNVHHRAKITLEQAGFKAHRIQVPLVPTTKIRRICVEADPTPRFRRFTECVL